MPGNKRWMSSRPGAKHKQKGWCSRAGDWSYLLPSMPCLSVLLHLLAFCAGRSSLQGPQAATESFPSLRRQPTHPRTPRPSATGPTCQDPGRQRRDGPCAHRRLGPGPSTRSRTPRAHAQLSGSSSRGSLAGEEVVASQFSPRRFFFEEICRSTALSFKEREASRVSHKVDIT